MIAKLGIFTGLVPFLLPALLAAPAASQAAEEYDYIVVGSGPGGGPLAVNLAKANYSVLLLEAGDDSLQGGGQYPPTITWDFFVKHYEDEERVLQYHRLTWRLPDGRYWVGPASQPPPQGAELLGVYYPRGATLGGSTMINAMFTFLPPDSDWDYVVNITGDTSWSAEEMRRHFVAIEDNNYVPEGTAGHGFDGYFPVSMARGTAQGSFGAILQSSSDEIGIDRGQVTAYLNSDPNFLDPERDQTQGIWGLPTHTRPDGSRWSARHLVEDTLASGQYPLTLQMNSFVSRVLFADNNNSSTDDPAARPRATGVEIFRGKSVYRADPRSTGDEQREVTTATARKEVIVAGGAFNTPQILMVSGIGPTEHLQEFDIPVVADLPGVGANLMDNQELPIVGLVPQQGGGGGGFGIAVTVIKTEHAAYDERDVFFTQAPYVFRGFWPDAHANRELAVDPPNSYGVALVKMHPQNRAGTVRLRSADPLDVPDINFRLYAEGAETDLGAIRDTVAWARRVYGATAAPYGPVRGTEPPCPSGAGPDGVCASQQEDDDWIYGQTFGHHPTSTCRIGADDDPGAVLDSRFRVRGVDGLRVVDASAFARIPGAFPVVSTFIISQKAAETILEEEAAKVEARVGRK